MSPARLNEDAPRLTPETVRSAANYLESWLEYRRGYLRVPGVQAALLFDGEVMLSCAFGDADAEAGIPLTTDHLFRIASHSKTFTATAIFQLLERGLLRLDDRAGEWLPFLDETASPVANVSLREMLGHSGGVIRDGSDADFWQLSRAFPDADELREITGPGSAVLDSNERFKYSNIAYGLLGLVVEAASGQPYNDYVRKEIVQRLDLSRTGPELDPERRGEYATGYTALSYADKRLPIEHVDTRALAAATGFFSTAEDLCRYAAAHFTSDVRLVSDASKRLMHHEWWPIDGVPDSGYGLGFSVIACDKRRMLGHGGGYPGHITRTLFDPDDRLAVVVLTNSIDGPAEELATSAVKIIDLAAKDPGDVPDSAQRFCGRLANLWGVRDVALLGGRLYLVNPAAPEPTSPCPELTVVDDESLRVAESAGYSANGELMRYEFDTRGAVRFVRGPGGMTWWPIQRFQLPDERVTSVAG